MLPFLLLWIPITFKLSDRAIGLPDEPASVGILWIIWLILLLSFSTPSISPSAQDKPWLLGNCNITPILFPYSSSGFWQLILLSISKKLL